MTAPLALTLGDPAGVGPEIAAKAAHALAGRIPFFLIGDAGVAARAADALNLPCTTLPDPGAPLGPGLSVLDHPLPAPAHPGNPDPANAQAVIDIIDRAVALTRTGQAAAVVTNPINKKLLYDGAGFAFPGHTEYLAHLGGVDRSVMLLAAPGLRVVPVTIHIALADVPSALTPALLEETLRITAAALRRDFGLAAPRIAVAGLNPHAGEGGAMGQEDATVIAPVLAKLRSEGMVIDGPRPADTLFHEAARAAYDVAVCMYHDQALIPIKTIDFAGGVNVTLGLPFVRTSPDHGTAYDIAGTGRADPTSLIAALTMAGDIVRLRG
ncbi:MAG: 4-hydroxythreonine-4-phosphate dehydrogenase PdxA [Pseudomonadota bacterium]